MLQISYFIYSTIFVDFADSGPGKKWIQPRLQKNKNIRDFVFISLVFPLTIVSTILTVFKCRKCIFWMWYESCLIKNVFINNDGDKINIDREKMLLIYHCMNNVIFN